MKRIFMLLTTAILLASCGDAKPKKAEEATQEETKVEAKAEETKSEEATQEAAKTEATDEKVAEEVALEITGDDAMKFDKNELRVKAGQKVTLTLKHVGKSPKDQMGHNWVLLKKGTDLAGFATKAMAAKDKDYIPSEDDIIAHTKLLGGGESDSVTFVAPEKGEYDYLCSFPGHYAMMKGKLIVE